MSEFPTYSFDWQLREHAHVVRLLMQERLGSGIWRVMRWAVVIILALATVLAVASALLGDFGSALRLGPLVILVGGMTFWFETWTGWIRAWQIRRMDPATLHPLSLALEETGLRVITKAAETHLKWEGLHKVRETPDLFMFYYSPRIAYYLPKRAARGHDGIDAVRDLIKERLPSEVPYQEG
jgi:hypothetical protein